MADPGQEIVPVSFTKAWHSQPYPFISPTRPELSAKGKNIVITGGGTGIGNAIGVAFAKAGANSIAIIGRRADKLAAGVSAISEAAAAAASSSDMITTVFHMVADLVDKGQTTKAFDAIAAKVGKIDVFVSNAGASVEVGPMATYSAQTFRQAFELNVVTGLHAFQAFLPHASPGRSVVLNSTTALAHIAPWANVGAYPVAKAAALKMWDQIAKENTHLRVVSVHPGWVPTDLNGHQKEATDSGESSLFFGCFFGYPSLLTHSFLFLKRSSSILMKERKIIRLTNNPGPGL